MELEGDILVDITWEDGLLNKFKFDIEEEGFLLFKLNKLEFFLVKEKSFFD
jgi:hypothetical protein